MAGNSRDPFWNIVESYGVHRVFALPDWIGNKEEKASENLPIEFSSARRLLQLRQAVADCRRCQLASSRTNTVFGEGNPRSGILLVGEGPGATEDETGRPFVGRSGQLLDRILDSIGLDRTLLYIANIVKCRPPGNRTPTSAEAEICGDHLSTQIDILEPGVILALGASAARHLLDTKSGIGMLRGKFHSYRGIPLLVTYHPAALLRSPAFKRPVWEDMKMLRAFLQESGLPRKEESS
jgi:uracil-DNA glycosylase